MRGGWRPASLAFTSPAIVKPETQLVIANAIHPRAEWDAAFAKMAERRDDELLDTPIPTKWDETDW